MNEIKSEPKIEVKKINIPKVGKLVLSDKVKEYIDCLHKRIGATEWSGMLFYKIESGDIKTMKDIVFKSDFIYPRDIGSSAYTETVADGDVSDAYDIYEDGIECSVGLIHSHHNMNCFFSSTDSDELLSNAKLYNYYISLIVNFDGKYCAKIAFPGKQKFTSTTTLIDSDGKPYDVSLSGESDVIFIGDLDVDYNRKELIIEEWLDLKIKSLQEAKKSKSIFPKGVDISGSWNTNVQKFSFENQKARLQMSAGDNMINSKKKATGKDLLASLIVCSPEADQYTDKTTFIAQDLKYNCEDEQFGAMTIEFIQDNFEDLYIDLFGDFSDDNAYLANLNDMLKELMMYEKLYSDKWFFIELAGLIETGIEEIKYEINLSKKTK